MVDEQPNCRTVELPNVLGEMVERDSVAVRRLRRLIAVARGERPADLVLRGGRVANVFTGELLREDVAIVDDRIAGLGRYRGRMVLDVAGGVIAPGLIDAHFHLESTMLTPAAFARAVAPRGTTAVVVDPHEIGNVAGVTGVHRLLAATHGLPLTFHCQAPSCVPASRMETTGGRIGSAGVRSGCPAETGGGRRSRH